jgi:hypothetical protein
VAVHGFTITGPPQRALLVTSELPLSATAWQDARVGAFRRRFTWLPTPGSCRGCRRRWPCSAWRAPADVVSSVFRMMIVQQVTPDAIQGRVNSLIFAGLQGGPRLGDAEAGAAAALAGPQFAAWSGGLLSVVAAVVTRWAIPEFWRYRSRTGPAPGTREAATETAAG